MFRRLSLDKEYDYQTQGKLAEFVSPTTGGGGELVGKADDKCKLLVKKILYRVVWIVCSSRQDSNQAAGPLPL